MKKYIYKLFVMAIIATAFTSCLKDDNLVLDPAKGVNVIEFANPAQIAKIGTVFAMYTLSYDIGPDITLPVEVSYSGPEAVAPQDITVNYGPGTAANVTAYNTENNSTYSLMPTNAYTLPGSSVVIKKGESKAKINVIFKPSAFDLTKNLVLPLTITSSSFGIVSGNFSTILLNVGAKNKYDGVYTYTATHQAPDRPAFLIGTEFTYPFDVQLRSSGAATNNLFNTAFGDFLMPLVLASGGASGFGQTNLLITFDPATNKVIAASNAITAATNGRKMNLDDTAVGSNFYNPTTKEVFITYFMTQPGFSPFKVTAKLKFKGPR